MNDEQRRFRKALELGLNYSVAAGRMKSVFENLQTLPKSQVIHDEITFDFSEVETHLISAAFPGDDGIGADVKIERVVGASPVLSLPYGVAADILTMEDVFYEQADAYTSSRRLKAKVLRFDPNKDSAEIEFEDKNLIPPRIWVPTYSLRQRWGGRVVNREKYCPKCEVPWKEVVLARFSVWDCPSCGAKKEDYAR